MRQRLLSLILILTVLPACQQQCSREAAGCNELANKSEYSLLQAMSFRLRDRPHDRSFLIFREALDTDFTVVAFPLSKSETGYVALLANAEIPPLDKSVPNGDFIITPRTSVAVKERVKLSPSVETYMAGMAARASSPQ